MMFTSTEDVKAYRATAPAEVEEAVEDPPAEESEPVEVPPVEDEVSVLHREAEEAMKRVHRLKSRLQDALREHERLGAEIKDAEKAASEACARPELERPPLMNTNGSHLPERICETATGSESRVSGSRL